MTPIRYLAWAPMLLPGLALLYSMVDRLLGAPCPDERIERVVGHLVTGAFALYFLAGYGLGIARAYLALGIATLWAWQLFVIAPVLAPACGGIFREELWMESIGLFLGFIAGIVALGIATSIVLHRRYRVVPAATSEARRIFLVRTLSGASLLAVLLSAAVYVIAPMLLKTYAALGADLPGPTLALLAGYEHAALLAVPFVAALLYAAVRRRWDERQLDAALTSAIGLLIALNVCASGLMFAAYAPMLKLCSCV
jgi:hypothetical protein